jgi:cytochrome bd-type quinol oxidase subunit 2
MGSLLSISCLAAHLVAMNIAAAGPLACAYLTASQSSDLEWARRLARWSLASLIVGAFIGGLLLVSPSQGMRASLARFSPDTYWFAAAELVFSLCCLVLLARLSCGPKRRVFWTWILAFATATNLLYHFPPLMAAIGKIAVDPRWATDPVVSHPVLLRLAARPEVLSLWFHFVLASVTGAAIVSICSSRGMRDRAATDDAVAVRRFAAAALIATLLQLPVGMWVLLTSSGPEQDALMGQDWRATSCFAAGVLLAMGLLQALAAISAGDTQPPARRRAAGLFVAVAILMAATLTLSRTPDARSEIESRRPAALTSSQAL